MIGHLRQIKKVIIWVVVICVVASGGAIAWFARPSLSLNYSMAVKVFSEPYISISYIGF